MKDWTAFIERAGYIAEKCKALEMRVSAGLFEAARKNPPQTEREFELLKSALQQEIGSKFFLYVPNHRAAHFENDAILSARAKGGFATAYAELREAGSCYAVGRYTGCVLHAMRSVEVGVKAMSRALGYSPPDLEQQDWHPILEKCESIIRDMKALPRGQQKEEDTRFTRRQRLSFGSSEDAMLRQPCAPMFQEAEAKAILEAYRFVLRGVGERLAE